MDIEQKIIDKTGTTNVSLLRDNDPKTIVVHSTFRKTFEDILEIHKNRNNWAGVGYHFFIDSEGRLYQARPYNKEGAHALGFNLSSIGICAYGGGNISAENVCLTRELIDFLKERYNPDIEIISHTLAQIKYANHLFEKYRINKRLDADQEIVVNKNFEMMRDKLIALLTSKTVKSKPSIVRELKEFKNCPGEWFMELLK